MAKNETLFLAKTAAKNHILRLHAYLYDPYMNNSLYLTRKHPGIFVRGHYMSREANGELWGTGNAQGQISEHIFAPNGGYRLYCPSNIFRNTPSFKKVEFSRIFLSFGRGLFGHVKYLDQSLASENIWWIIKRNTPWGTTIKLSSVRCPYTHDIAVVKFSSLHFLPWSSIFTEMEVKFP